jgi:putative oxidoreductase
MTHNKTPSKWLHIGLWVVQCLLASIHLWAGVTKLTKPADELAQLFPWTAGNDGLVTLTGIVDLLAGIGLILPALLRIMPQLTGYAAVGVILLMIAASVFHLQRGESSQILTNVIFATMALFVAWGRLYKAPITPKASQSHRV